MPEVFPEATQLEQWDYVRTRANFPPRDFVLEFALNTSGHIPGNVVEFGVATGDSTRVIRKVLDKIARKLPAARHKQIFACDSFKGLPERFEKAEVGTFACKPPRIRGVQIVKGYFQDSLDNELARQVGRVSFASLDADLYSSTLCALRWLTPLLQSGSLLLFDEFLGENASEKRAFEEWSAETGVKTVLIAEFLRDPSGWGERLDRRMLFQVVRPEEIPPRPKSWPRTQSWSIYSSPTLRPLVLLARRAKRALKG
jgi:hypothetical protein